jgi:hypothetical protein
MRVRLAVPGEKSVLVAAVDVGADDGRFWAIMSVLLSLFLTLRTSARSRVALLPEIRMAPAATT